MMDGRSQSRQSQAARCGWLCASRVRLVPAAAVTLHTGWSTVTTRVPQGSLYFFWSFPKWQRTGPTDSGESPAAHDVLKHSRARYAADSFYQHHWQTPVVHKMLSNIVKSASRHAIRATTKRSSPFAVFTPRHQHSATPLPIQSVDTEKIKVLPSPNSIHADLAQTDTQTLSHGDPGPESQSANFIDQFSPYLLTTYSRPPVVFN
jgi:hypothetical protein